MHFCIDNAILTLSDQAICNTALGMENYGITSDQLSESSKANDVAGADYGRLDRPNTDTSSGSWRAGTEDQNQWIQVDFNSSTVVTAIVTQGRDLSGANQWVTQYSVEYTAHSGSSWTYVSGESGTIVSSLI